MSEQPDLVNKKLGDYKLTKKLATGGMSYIYIGIDEILGRRAAIKVLTPDIAADDDTLAVRFKREARAVAQLEHDNIIPIYQFGEESGVYFLAMRFIDGHDLADEINNLLRQGKKIDIHHALDILGQVASALDYAHERGIIHRDVKPSNILLDQNNKATLSDFGLVLWSSVDNTLGTAFGTPRYISPEQATDSQAAVPQSDIYALGVILYEIVTGRMLYTGKTPMEMAISHITETPTAPRQHNPNIPPAVEREILKALEKEPEARHRTATEFIDALKKIYTSNDVKTKDASIHSAAELAEKADWSAITSAEEEADDPDDTLLMDTMSRPSAQAKKVPTMRLDAAAMDHAKTITVPPSVPSRKKRRVSFPLFIISVIFIMLVAGATFYVTGGSNFTGLILPESPIPQVGDVPLATDEPAATNTLEPPTASDTIEPTIIDPPTNTPTATAILASDTPVPIDTVVPVSPETLPTEVQPISPNRVLLTLIYNVEDFVIRNDSRNPISLDGMTITATIGETEGDFDGASIPGGVLPPGECVLIRASDEDPPASWNCQNIQSSTLLQTQTLFWFADSQDDTSFDVMLSEEIVVTCDTVGRAVGRLDDHTCVVNPAASASG